MCGIAGTVDFARRLTGEQLSKAASAMGSTLVHRGPDDDGLWVDAERGIAFAFRRLSIIDLTSEGHQPMLSRDGRWVMVFNGEVYNFVDLRNELEASGTRFRGHSDSEVLVELIASRGFQPAIERCNGMFAIAAWDCRDQRLFFARDRVGEKPLYVGRFGSTLAFGSELKALHAHPSFQGNIDPEALALYLRHGYVPAPRTIFTNITKVPPAVIHMYERGGTRRESSYWSALDVANDQTCAVSSSDDIDTVDALREALTDSVRRRMIADVPLGALLSGGIDSSTVVALMQSQSSRPVRTFSVGFAEGEFNEAHHAADVARHLGTDHTEVYVSPRDALEVVPQIPTLWDEPFGDPSSIPTYLVCKLARQSVTVTVTGDGGDELFGGYDRYAWTEQIWAKLLRVPTPARSLGSRLLGVPSAQDWERPRKWIGRVSPAAAARWPGRRAYRLGQVLGARSADQLYTGILSAWQDPAALVDEPGVLEREAVPIGEQRDLLTYMQYRDLTGYLPDDILTKIDRASMAVGLESRIPLLDHRVVELAFRTAPETRVKHGVAKWPLRQILYHHVPPALVDRPKMGFGAPVAGWLRGPLREWADDLLSLTSLRATGMLRPEPVLDAWAQHRTASVDRTYELWNILMFQSWAREWKLG